MLKYMNEKLLGIADSYNYEGLMRTVFLKITGPIAFFIGFISIGIPYGTYSIIKDILTKGEGE